MNYQKNILYLCSVLLFIYLNECSHSNKIYSTRIIGTHNSLFDATLRQGFLLGSGTGTSLNCKTFKQLKSTDSPDTNSVNLCSADNLRHSPDVSITQTYLTGNRRVIEGQIEVKVLDFKLLDLQYIRYKVGIG